MNRLVATLIALGIGFTAVHANTSQELSRLRIDADWSGSIEVEYLDAPTDAWRQRLSLYRLA